jgi:hypothetical protein
MHHLRTTLGALAAAGGISAFVLAGVPALASGHSAAMSITGPEVAAGTVHGKAALANAPTIPLKLTGVVAARSTVHLGNGGAHKGSTKTLKTTKGNLTVRITAKPQTTQSLNTKTCRAEFAEYIQISAVGGKSTGAFAGASGPGAVQVAFAATVPRFKSGPHKGQCNFNGTPKAKGAVVSFLASLVLTVR